MQKLIYTILILFVLTSLSFSQARRIVIEMNHATTSPRLTESEVSIIGGQLTQLLRKYIEFSSFQNNQGTYSNEHTDSFLQLFEDDALIYSDLHVAYRELNPSEYARIVKSNFGDYGLDATIDYAGLISLQKSSTNNEYIAHLVIEKVNYSKITTTGERIFFKDGQRVKFDVYVKIDLAEASYKISAMSNDLAPELIPLVYLPRIETESLNLITARNPIVVPVSHPPSSSYVEVVPVKSDTHVTGPQLLRISRAHVFGSDLSNPELASSISSSKELSVMMYMPVFRKKKSFMTLGISVQNIEVNSTINNENLSLLDTEPIAYISTSRNHLLELNEESNLKTFSQSGTEVKEQLQYRRIMTSIGLSHRLNQGKLAIYLGAEVLPGRLIFKDGNREFQTMEAYKIPNTIYFPDVDVINSIDPSSLRNQSYLISDKERTPIYDGDRYEINAGLAVMLNYQLHERISISTKMSQRLSLWNQKNERLDNHLAPVINNTDNQLNINSMLIDLGVIFKY